ncbi:MAG: antibiotic biosynthesis monooxygenase [Planctomycetota bacterium]
MNSEARFAVIFRSRRREDSDGSYERAADRMLELARQQDGFVDASSVRDHTRRGITVSYWRDLESIKRWYEDEEHRTVQEQGREHWYSQYDVEVCKIEGAYSFKSGS